MSMGMANPEMFPKPEALTVPLTGGLDFISPKTQVNPGSLQECMNYEVARESGYSLSRGLMAYSGRSLRATNTYLLGKVQDTVGSPQIYAGGIYTVENQASSQQAKIKVYLLDGTDLYFQAIEGRIGEVTASLFFVYPDANDTTEYYEVDEVVRSEYATTDEFISKFELVNSSLAGGNDTVPGEGPINVLFELNDKIYAARDLPNGTGSQLYTTTDLEELNQNVDWEAVDMGFTLPYKEGRTRPFTLSDSQFLDEPLPSSASVSARPAQRVRSEVYTGAAESLGGGTTTAVQENQIPWQTTNNALDDTGGTGNNTSSRGFVALGSTAVADEFRVTQALRFSGFDIGRDQPSTSEVTNISVSILYEHAHTSQFPAFDAQKKAAMLSARLLGVGSSVNKSTQTIRTATNNFGADPQTGKILETLADTPANWGVPNITREQLFSAAFGIEFVFAHAKGSDLMNFFYGAFTKVYWVRISVTLSDSTEEVFFYDTVNSVDVASAKVAEITQLEGSFASNNSKGLYTLYETSGTIGNVVADLEVRSLANGEGTLLAKTDGAVTQNLLPTSTAMAAEDSFAQTIKANFSADPRREAVYGVTGAGPAFSFNGTYFHFIRAPIPEAVDKPRHIAEHENHLVLGFSSGSILLSVLADPTNFSGLEGASEFGFGDNVTDLLPLVGSALGVMCKQSAHALVGNTIDNFTTQNISKTSGALEYSSAIIGQPLYADFRGIATIEATQQYGDFTAGRLSQAITDILQSRLQEVCGFCVNREKLVCAMPVRSRNQYRLFFADGLIVTLTLAGTDDMAPMFTTQNYGWDTSTPTRLNNEYVPTAALSTVLRAGSELNMIGCADGKVYITDQGTGIITGSGIEEYDAILTLNPFNGGQAHSNLKYNELMLHGKTGGKQELICTSGVNYLVPSPNTTEDTIIMGGDRFGFFVDRIPQKKSTHLPNVTAGFSLKVRSKADGNVPHILQAVTFRPIMLSDQGVGQKRSSPPPAPPVL